MLRKIWAIAAVNIYTTFTDRNLLIIMIVTPLILATIISLAFGNLGGSSSPITNIPVAIVNLDTPPAEGSQVVDSSGILLSAFIPPADTTNTGTEALGTCEAVQVADNDAATPNTSLTDLTEAKVFDDPAAAKAAVDKGDYAAAVIIPAGFSESIGYTQQHPDIKPVAIEVYGDSAQPISASIIHSVVAGFTNQLLTGQIAVASTIGAMIDRAQQNPMFGLSFAAAASGGFQPDFSCAFTPGFNTVKIEQQTVTGQEVKFNPLVVFGSAQAVFFALFTANGVAASIIEERRQGTLQRMVVSPTPRVLILTGKLIATFLVVVLQLAFLFIGFTVIGSLLEGQIKSVWGNDFVAIAALILATSAATAGVGMLTAAIGKTAEQANIIGSVVSMLMGILGGAFFAVTVLGSFEWVTRLSVVRWGSEGFSKLASGQGDIGLNMLFLALIGAVLFIISLAVFTRRQDI
jgi:ABC-2 type transport system permease protein